MRPSALPIVRVVAACYPVDPSRAPLPGAPKALDTQVLELGAEVLQQNSPASGLVMYVHGFHHESGNRVMQEDAHHDCRPVNEDVIQCAIYDGNAYDARLIGVEQGFTADGQIDGALLDWRDRLFGVSVDGLRESRQDIGDPGFDAETLREPVCECR